MAQKKKPYLKLVKPLNLDEAKRRAVHHRRNQTRKWIRHFILGFMAVSGTWMLITNHTYDTVYRSASYRHHTSDSSGYAAFGDGIVRYTRDGVTYLDRKNKEQWIQPSQFKNPSVDVQEHVFAVGDTGGNAIQVFNEEGLKGEIETAHPIEKFAVSDQGIVSVILKNESMPQIVTYDAVGNILVENQVSDAREGYPTALEMSPDGKVLMVSYLTSAGDVLRSKVVCYNFGEAGEEQTDKQVGTEEYEDSVIPEIYFMNASVSVAVGDHSFAVYEGGQVPVKQREIQIDQEIRSSFHTDKYIGFVLLNREKSGYEVRLYNKAGKQVMNRAFTGEYSNVQMVGDEIMMYEGSACCIITKTGVPRFKGDLKTDAQLMIPAAGLNKYLVMGINELRAVYLAK